MDRELADAFCKLDAVLTNNQSLWRSQPFSCGELPWKDTHPHLIQALLELDDEEVRELHDQPLLRFDWFNRIEPELCLALSAFEPQVTAHVTKLCLANHDSVHIPGRKWQQIVAFAAALPTNQLPVVDWCAGKGHLSRIVARAQQQPVHCLEWDASLVAAGEKLAKQQNLKLNYYQHDVMQAAPRECAVSARLHMGLHACGKLHRRLLQHVSSTAAQAVSLSPCCYHKIATDHYLPLSELARSTQLQLDRPALHLAVQDTVTARRGERRLREQERLWRLAFDSLQRETRGLDEYLSVPSCKRSVLRQDFPSFCRWAASCRALKLAENINYDVYLEKGRVKHRQVVRLELLRALFSRTLELWLVLDSALFLQEQDYKVSVTQFCERDVSPRNLLIQAQRR